jgi:asparagine synthase (glutamine-hydrolysing)
MCGFAGIFTSSGLNTLQLGAQASRMIAPIVHRGPDDSGVWADEPSGMALGFRRLAIIDVSPNGHQPMWSPSRRFVMVFNGEVYNFAALRCDLEGYGYRFRGHSDTEVILAAFEQWGIPEAVTRFVGMFAIAVWDADRRQLSLIRDRLGKKPLYVYSEPGLVTFGSELKSLLAGPSFDRTIDREALAAYFRYLYVPAPKSIFARAIKLPAAHILTISDPRLPLPRSTAYWSLRDVALNGSTNQIAGSDAEAIDQLDALLTEAVECRMRADVPLGALLSGGIDSSLVVSSMQQASHRSVKTYTIGFAEEEFNEARFAARVAQHLGTDHTELLLTGDDVHALIPRLPQVFDEPLADPSQLPTLLVSQLARQHVTVALSGDGGDELFGGYDRYVHGGLMLPGVMRLPRTIRRGMAAGIESVRPETWDRLARLAAPLVPGLPDRRFGERIHKLSTLMNADSVGDMYRSLLSAWHQTDGLLRERPGDADLNTRILNAPEPAHLLDRMMLADQTVYLPDDLLAKLDRASMAVSLEVRAPLLDHRLVEFSWRLPRSLKLRNADGKWILRHLLYRRVPAEMVDRPKMGFSVPIDRWLRGPLREWAANLLSRDELERSELNPGPIRRAWQELQEGRRPAGRALWSVVMFQAWRSHWNISSTPAAASESPYTLQRVS